jgi:hypothetical protein
MAQMDQSKRMLVAEMWNDYARTTVPANSPATLRKFIKASFYAGAWGMLKAVTYIASSKEAKSADAFARMDMLMKEMLDFEDDVRAGTYTPGD